MEMLGERRFVEIPGDSTHELPPLLVREATQPRRLGRVMEMASHVVDKEDLVPSVVLDEVASEADVERRKMDLAINLVERYLGLLHHWHWGDGILEWIRQCEITFDSRSELKRLLRPDVWPHAARSSFVILLEDKGVRPEGVEIENAVGLRLAFRQPPPLHCISDQFLFYLNKNLASVAYQTWSHMAPEPISAFPPERFHVQVVRM